MGEKRLKEYLTLKDLAARFGRSMSSFYGQTKDLEPALLKINGKPMRPYRYDSDVIDQLITSGGTKPAVTKRERRKRVAKVRVWSQAKDSDDEALFD